MTNDTTDEQIETGVGYIHSIIPGDYADEYPYVYDGEYATVWCVFRHSDHEIAITTYRCKGGRAQRDGHAGKKYFEVDPDMTTTEWARQYAQAHKSSIQAARDYFK